MTPQHPGPRVAVIGGGVLGTSTAAQLAHRGADVTLITEAAVANGASGRSLSWLNSFGSSRSADYHQLRLLGIDRYRTYLARVPGAGDYLKFDGGLTWAADDHTDSDRAAFEHMRRIGYDAHWLTPDEIGQWTPGIDPAALPPGGAIFNPGEGWVDLPQLIRQMVTDLHRYHGRVFADSGPATVEVRGDQVQAVNTGTGHRIEVDAVVLATGADVPGTVAEVGAKIRDATEPALLVRTTPVPTPLRAVINSPRISLRPDPSGALVMDADWAAQQVRLNSDGSYGAPQAAIDGLLSEASAVLLDHPTLTLDSYGAGPKPVPADGDPVLGELAEIRGYFVAFTHSGATLALIAGELLAQQIITGTPSPLLDAFRPTRFT